MDTWDKGYLAGLNTDENYAYAKDPVNDRPYVDTSIEVCGKSSTDNYDSPENIELQQQMQYCGDHADRKSRRQHRFAYPSTMNFDLQRVFIQEGRAAAYV